MNVKILVVMVMFQFLKYVALGTFTLCNLQQEQLSSSQTSIC
jgi:hypothetical protein